LLHVQPLVAPGGAIAHGGEAALYSQGW
jgi:hypothetical protein